jgi:hypothetical protein
MEVKMTEEQYQAYLHWEAKEREKELLNAKREAAFEIKWTSVCRLCGNIAHGKVNSKYLTPPFKMEVNQCPHCVDIHKLQNTPMEQVLRRAILIIQSLEAKLHDKKEKK